MNKDIFQKTKTVENKSCLTKIRYIDENYNYVILLTTIAYLKRRNNICLAPFRRAVFANK